MIITNKTTCVHCLAPMRIKDINTLPTLVCDKPDHTLHVYSDGNFWFSIDLNIPNWYISIESEDSDGYITLSLKNSISRQSIKKTLDIDKSKEIDIQIIRAIDETLPLANNSILFL
jgi:hypothetical protein